LVIPAGSRSRVVLCKMRGAKTLINYHSGEARSICNASAPPSSRSLEWTNRRPSATWSTSRDFGLPDPSANIVDLSQFRYRERIPLRPHLVCTRGFSRTTAWMLSVASICRSKKRISGSAARSGRRRALEGDIRNWSGLESDRRQLAGVASRQEIGKYYDQADIFINASWLDTCRSRSSKPCVGHSGRHHRAGSACPIWSSTSAPDCFHVGDEKSLAANVIACCATRAICKPAQTATKNRKVHMASRPPSNG